MKSATRIISWYMFVFLLVALSKVIKPALRWCGEGWHEGMEGG